MYTIQVILPYTKNIYAIDGGYKRQSYVIQDHNSNEFVTINFLDWIQSTVSKSFDRKPSIGMVHHLYVSRDSMYPTSRSICADSYGKIILDRSTPNRTSPGYYTKANGIDITQFTVDRDIYLTGIELPQIYLLSNEGEKIVIENKLQAKLKIIDLNADDHNERTKNGKKGKTGKNSLRFHLNSENILMFSMEMHLKANHSYEIQVTLPEQNIYAFDGVYKDTTFVIDGNYFRNAITIKMLESIQLDGVYHHFRKVSVGMVQRLHFKRGSMLKGIFGL